LGAGAGGSSTLSHSTLPSAREEISLWLLSQSPLSKRYRMDAAMTFISLHPSPLVLQKLPGGHRLERDGFCCS